MRKAEKYLGNFFLKLLKLSIPPEKYSAENFEHSQIKNILVILRHQMGDTICALPMLKALREFYDAAHVTLVTKSSTNYSEIFREHNPYTDDVKEYENGFENFVYLIKELRERYFDLAVIPPPVVFSVTNHLTAHYSKAKYRAGAASADGTENPCAFLLNIKKDFHWRRKKVHQSERNLDIIRQINILPASKHIEITVSRRCADYARRYLRENFTDSTRKIIGFHPGAGKPENVWDAENFAETIFHFKKEFNPYIYISEGPQDRDYVRRLVSILREKYNEEGIKIHRGGLMENAAVISLLDLFITNDTGPMHLAGGMDVPMVSLFGASKAYEWAPVGENKISIQSSSGSINDIKTQQVFETGMGLLRKGRRREE